MPKEQEKKQNNLHESMQRAYSKVSKEMPDVKPVSVTPSTSGLLSRFFAASGNASTNPFTGNIYYNPSMMEGLSDFEKEQILTHELTHSRQVQNKPWLETVKDIFFRPDANVPNEAQGRPFADTPYWWRPHELEAYQAQRDRATRMKIPYTDPIYAAVNKDLFPPRKPSGINTAPTTMPTTITPTKKPVKVHPDSPRGITGVRG